MPSRPPHHRRAALAALILAALCLLGLGREARAAGDPYLEWWTLETKHFRVHYYRGLEPVAEKVAAMAEGIHRRLVPVLGWEPTEVTEIVLTDNTDDANGSATALPYNTVRLFVTAPDDMSPLGDYDDWYLELVTHEYTHILHTDNITGLPAVANAVVGKQFAPNQVQPRWILEGLAVLEESRHTGGGRNRSSIFDMYLRADVLEKNLAPLDQMSHQPRRWPQGNLWYLYGSRFLTWITDVYGEHAMLDMANDYGRHIIPWGINRSIRRATGRTYPELYEGWSAYLEERYARQVAEAAARGLREGTRLTHHGQTLGRPRWVPKSAQNAGAKEELLYWRDDGHSTPGFYRLPLADRSRSMEDSEELLVRSSGNGSACFEPDGAILFNSTGVTSRIYRFNDLYRLPPRTDGSSGFEPERQRLTTGARAQDPDESPDGRFVVYTENHRGTTTLILAERTAEGGLARARALVPSARFEQAFTPRFSPDGRKVAYSAWTAGGYRDVRVVDVDTGRFFEIAHDRAQDLQPSFSPDGRTVYFSSDRVGGIPNVLAYDLATGKLAQVTNVKTGAFQPEVSPDGKTLVYVGYASGGFELYAMPLDPGSFLDVPPYTEARPDLPSTPRGAVEARHPYDPLASLRPRSWTPLSYGPGTFGQTLSIQTDGADAVGHHAYTATMNIAFDRPELMGSVGYTYGRLPFDLRTSIFRSVAPATGYRYNDQEPVWIRSSVGVTSSLNYALPGPFDANSFALGYSISRFGGELPLDPKVDPYATVGEDPPRGYLGSMHLGWSYSNAERYLWSVGPERGFNLYAGVDVATRPLASEYTLYVFSYAATQYVPMPWAAHHSIGLHAMGAAASGDYPYRGLFYTGGFVDQPFIDQNYNPIYQSSFVLRGYAPIAFIGSEYHLFNAEYRFPVLNVDRGISTLPVFLNRVTGAVFADYGGAFDHLDTLNWRDQFHLGVGAELWIESTVGYFVTTTLRVGYARGVKDPAAIPGGQTYFVLAAPY